MYLQRKWWCLLSFFPSPRPTQIHWNCPWHGAQLEHRKHWNWAFRCHYHVRCPNKKKHLGHPRMEHLRLLHLSLKGHGCSRGSVLPGEGDPSDPSVSAGSHGNQVVLCRLCQGLSLRVAWIYRRYIDAESTFYDFQPFLGGFFDERSACEEQFDYRDGENISSGSCSTVCDWAQTHHRSRLEAKFGDLASRVPFVLELWTVLQPFCFFIGMFWDIWYPSFFAYSAYSTHSLVGPLDPAELRSSVSLVQHIWELFSLLLKKSCVAEGITSWMCS